MATFLAGLVSGILLGVLSASASWSQRQIVRVKAWATFALRTRQSRKRGTLLANDEGEAVLFCLNNPKQVGSTKDVDAIRRIRAHMSTDAVVLEADRVFLARWVGNLLDFGDVPPSILAAAHRAKTRLEDDPRLDRSDRGMTSD